MVKMNQIKNRIVIDGHNITISFSNAPNPGVLSRIKNILLSSGSASHICQKLSSNDRIQRIKEGV